MSAICGRQALKTPEAVQPVEQMEGETFTRFNSRFASLKSLEHCSLPCPTGAWLVSSKTGLLSLSDKPIIDTKNTTNMFCRQMQLDLPIFNDPESDGKSRSPGSFIQSELDKRSWGQATLAEILGRPLAAVNEIIKGKRAVTPEMAVALGRAFDQPPELWAHREAAYRLSLVKDAVDDDTAKKARLFEVAPIRDLQRRGWISPEAQTADELEAEITRFSGERPLSDVPTALPRKNAKLSEFSNAQSAWLMQAYHLAKKVNARTYSKASLKEGLPRIRKAAAKPEFAAKLPMMLAELGVRLVVIEDLPRTKIDGAAFFVENDGGLPVIALSVRMDRMDSFWHTLGHEIHHIVNEDPLSLDTDLVGKDKAQHLSSIEARADQEAADWLIPSREIKSFALRAKPLFVKEAILPFASRMGVHPCIVIGALNHMGVLDWNRHADLRPKIREHIISTATCDGYGRKPFFNLI
jgi:HTH-type transcriptional regulator / antitoxin HigA